MNNVWSDEKTDNSLRADDRNFYKVEKWTKDGLKVDRTLYDHQRDGNARELFADAIKLGPRIRLSIRQRTRVLYRLAGGMTSAPGALGGKIYFRVQRELINQRDHTASHLRIGNLGECS